MQLPIKHSSHFVRTVWGVVAFVLAILVLALVTFGFGLYAGGWHDRLTQRVVHVLPFPAAIVGNQALSFDTYLTELVAWDHYQTFQDRKAPGSIQLKTGDELRQSMLRQGIRELALQALLASHKLQVHDADVKQAFSSQVDQVGNRAVVLKTIHDLYDWNADQYQKYVLRTAVGREKFAEYLSFTKPYNQAAEKQAKEVLALVQAGDQSFQDIAKKYSEDAYGATGGDLGFISRGEMADEIDQAAFGLEDNQVSDVVHTKFGYHILKVTERKEVNGELQLHLFQITIAGPSADTYISEYLKQHPPHIFVPGFHWDSKKGDVVAN